MDHTKEFIVFCQRQGSLILGRHHPLHQYRFFPPFCSDDLERLLGVDTVPGERFVLTFGVDGNRRLSKDEVFALVFELTPAVTREQLKPWAERWVYTIWGEVEQRRAE